MIYRRLFNSLSYGGVISRHLSKHRCISTSFNLSNNKEEQHDEDAEKNPFFEKYADKIKSAQQNEAREYGTKNVHGDSRLKRETEAWKRKIQTVEEKLSEKKKERENKRGSKLPSRLDELIRMDLLESKTADEVGHIWTEHFKDQTAISAIIPADSYQEMLGRVEQFPTFLYPLPRENGYEFVLSQFEGNRCFFTSLINFQVHGENAPWQFCITFYLELAKEKGIVLMTSELDQSAMNIFEAQCLAQLQKLFYVAPDEKKSDLLFTFNKNPDAFKYMDLVKELENSDMIVKKT